MPPLTTMNLWICLRWIFARGLCSEGGRRPRKTFTHPSDGISIALHPLRTMTIRLMMAQNRHNKTKSPSANAHAQRCFAPAPFLDIWEGQPRTPQTVIWEGELVSAKHAPSWRNFEVWETESTVFEAIQAELKRARQLCNSGPPMNIERRRQFKRSSFPGSCGVPDVQSQKCPHSRQKPTPTVRSSTGDKGARHSNVPHGGVSPGLARVTAQERARKFEKVLEVMSTWRGQLC